MGASRQYQRAKETGAKAINVEWLASDIVPAVDDEKATTMRVTMAFTVTAPVVEVSYDSGATWIAINGGTAIPVSQLFAFDLTGFDNTDLINFRTPTTGGTTITIFRVDSLPIGS